MQQAIALPLPRAARAPAYHEPVQIGSDEALARRAARGDEAAFEELVVRHQDKLYTLALRVTLSEADAYDCVQEGLIAAWRALPLPRRRPLLDLDVPDRRAQGLRHD